MEEELKALLPQKWGKVWCNDFHFIKLTIDDIDNILQNEILPSHILVHIDKILKQLNCTVFIKLASTSPKDSEYSLKVNTSKEVNQLFMSSNRILNELYELSLLKWDTYILVRPWNKRIENGDEYRLLVCDGKLDIAIHTKTCTIDTTHIKLFSTWVDDNVYHFPVKSICIDVALFYGEVVFIEFNPINDELDLYGVEIAPPISETLATLLSKSSFITQHVSILEKEEVL